MPFVGLAFVTDFDFEFVADFGSAGKGDEQFRGGGFEFGGGFVYGDALDRQADGVEARLRRVFAQDGDGVSDVADDFALVGVEFRAILEC